MKPTQDQLIAWAREVGWQYAENDNSGYEPLWRAMRFAYEAGRKDGREEYIAVLGQIIGEQAQGENNDTKRN